MGWFSKKKKDDKKISDKPSREELIAQAHANARKARAEIGEETIQKIAAQFAAEQEKLQKKKQQGSIDQAKSKIRALDKDKVADHLRFIIDEEK